MASPALIRTLACAALAASFTAAFAADEAKPDDRKPPVVKPPDVKPQKVDIKFGPGADPKISIKEPQPPEEVIVPVISDDARKLIDQLGEAYGKLKSLELAGVFSGDIEAAGQHTGGKIPFTAFFESPGKFRHDGGNDVLIGFTGEKAYIYAIEARMYIQTDCPRQKVDTKELPAGFRAVLVQQNPSLRLALAKDAGRELIGDVREAEKVQDTKIDQADCPTLKLTLRDKTTAMVSIDSRTHLIRRVNVDVRAQLESQHVPNIKQAIYTVDYTTIKPDATMKPQQFAWAPPEGARDIKDVKPAGSFGQQPNAATLAGKDVPDFKLTGLDGKPVSQADLKGHVCVLDLWATWCPPCRASLPHLDKLYQEKKGEGLLVFAINVQEDKATVEAFVKKTNLGLPILLDLEGTTSEPFMVTGIPETVVVGKDGKVVKVFVGFDPNQTPEALKKVVEAALKK